MKRSSKIFIITFIVAIFLSMTTYATTDLIAYAVDESDESEIIEDEVIKVVETELENNFVSKDYEIEGEPNNNYLVEGGNEKAINLLATEQNISKGTLIENSNVEGKEYDMEIPEDEDFENKDPLELRQFITFETKSGKVFHIIVDHGKDSDNVMMLTEVGEQDLLNLIEEQAEVEIAIKEIKKEIESEIIEPSNVEESDESVGVEKNNNIEEIVDESKDHSLIIISVIAFITGIAGWYFKIYKPKHDSDFEDEDIDEADYIDDEEIYDEELLNEDEVE